MANFNLDNYVGVDERIIQFYEKFPEGRISTEIHTLDGDLCVIKASVYRSFEDAEPSATGHAYERAGEGYVNKTSHIENCETSAVGRALAFLGFEVKRGIASRQEMEKVKRMSRQGAQKPYQKAPPKKDNELELKKLRSEAKTLVETKCVDDVEEKKLLKGRQIDMMPLANLKAFIEEAKAF